MKTETDNETAELPAWVANAIENGIPLMQLWTGQWVLGWVQPLVRPGPRPLSRDEFIDRIVPAVTDLDRAGKRATLENVAALLGLSEPGTLSNHRRRHFPRWGDALDEARVRIRLKDSSNS